MLTEVQTLGAYHSTTCIYYNGRPSCACAPRVNNVLALGAVYSIFLSVQTLVESTVGLEVTEHAEHRTRLKAALKSVLTDTGELLSLSFLHDYRQHSVITNSQTLKRRTQRLLLALGAGRREEEGEEEEGGGGSRKRVIESRVKEVESTAQDLKKEVVDTHITANQSLSFSPADPCSDGPAVGSLSPASLSSGEAGGCGQGRQGDHCQEETHLFQETRSRHGEGPHHQT